MQKAKIYCCIFLSIVILFPLASKSLLIAWFKINQNEIAISACINKNNSKRKDCKGCCVLNEQLKKIDQSPSENSKLPQKEQKEKDEFQWLSFSQKNKNAIELNASIKLAPTIYIQNLNDQFFADIIKPPCLL